MVKLMKYIVVFTLFVMLISGIVYASEGDVSLGEASSIKNYAYINQLLLESSRYTQMDESNPAILDDYHNKYTLMYTPEELATLGFIEMFDTAKLTVYFEKDSFSLMIKNKETGYFWSSRPEFQGISGSREDNTSSRNLMNSGLWVQYVRANNVKTSTIETASLYTLADVKYMFDGSITAENPDHLRPYILETGSYLTRKVDVDITNHGISSFTAHVNLNAVDIEFDVEISLVDGALEVYIPNESILESADVYRLLNITLFPYFGAAREDKIPGYIVIPDGVGALVRTNQPYNTYFQARFFGSDMGYQTMSVPQLSIPIFGMVHESGENGYYVNILEGAENSTLLAYFWGSSTKYHRIQSRFSLRQIYKNVINKAGDGSDTIASQMSTSNYRASYQFLSNEDASYVGIAKDYRDYLISENILTDQEKVVDGNIPIQLSYIMSDREPSFIGTTKVTMTTANQVQNAYDYFYEQGLTNQQVVLMGWSNDGFIHQQPYSTRITGKNDYKDLAENIISDGNTVYLNNEYVSASEESRRVIYNRDVARNLSRLKMVFDWVSLNDQVTEVYYLYPDRSLAFAKSDTDFFNDLGVSGLMMTELGSTLFSYYDGSNYDRTRSMQYYTEIAELYDHLILSTPNSYMFKYASGYMDLPITNSQYDYYTDLVPLIPIILKGSMSYYTPYLNFNALAEDRFLTMVDFAVNPNYILTKEQTYEMRYTPSNVFYTTTLSDYEEDIVESYHYVNDALKHVVGAYVESREVIYTGLVLVTYSNGVEIFINYNYTHKIYGGNLIEARSYEVVLP